MADRQLIVLGHMQTLAVTLFEKLHWPLPNCSCGFFQASVLLEAELDLGWAGVGA